MGPECYQKPDPTLYLLHNGQMCKCLLCHLLSTFCWLWLEINWWVRQRSNDVQLQSTHAQPRILVQAKGSLCSWLQNWGQGEQIKLCNQPARLSSYTKLHTDCGQLPRFDQYTNPTQLARVLLAFLLLFELYISFCVSVTEQSSLFHVSHVNILKRMKNAVLLETYSSLVHYCQFCMLQMFCMV